MPGLVPVLRGLLLEELERLSLGDLLLGEPRGLVGAEVGSEKRGGFLDLAKRADGSPERHHLASDLRPRTTHLSLGLR